MTTSPNLAAASNKSRSRMFWLCLGFLTTIGVFFWTFDGWLLGRLRIIADDTFSIVHPNHPGLFMAGRDELRGYPPTRLISFAFYPPPQIRAVVLLSIADRRNDTDLTKWNGVVPKLIQVFSNDSDPMVRNCAGTALKSLPC